MNNGYPYQPGEAYTYQQDQFHKPGKFEDEKGPYVLAGFWIRVVAYLFDLIIVATIHGIFLGPFTAYYPKDSFLYLLLSVVLTGLYFTLMTKLNHGQTLGKMLLGLRVVSLQGDLTWNDVIIREAFGRYICSSIPLLYGLAAFTDKKQQLADIFADTTVVKEEIYEYLYGEKEVQPTLEEPSPEI